MIDTRTGARARIFAKLQKGLAAGPTQEQRSATVSARLANPPQHQPPARTSIDRDGLRRLFRGFLEGQSATVIEVDAAADIPHAVATYLRSNNLPLTVRTGQDSYLAELPWSKEPALRRDQGPAQAADETGLSHALAGVAETGTLALMSGADNPVTVTFVPETHIIVIEGRDLVGTYEAGWSKVRSRVGKGRMPRTVNFVSGPSRTADIGGTLVTGAHGPRRLCVILTRS
jgi:L-lactate dehydrogenase complex protein LldG